MVYLKKHNILFIHIPRTSGSNFERILGFNDHRNWREANLDLLFGLHKKHGMLQHATYQYIKKHKLVSNIEQANCVTIVRNPIYRSYSLFKYFKKHESFSEFIQQLEDGAISRYFYQPQYKYLVDKNGKIAVKNILRFENFEEDATKFKEKYGIEFHINFNKQKQIEKAKMLDKVITQEEKKRLRVLYAKDFEYFGY